MGRVASLEPSKDSAKDLWYVSLPPKLSPTGKRQRLYFQSRQEAEARALKAREDQQHSLSLLRKAGPTLIKAAVTFDELFQIYGFKGLEEACTKFANQLEVERKSVKFGELVSLFEDGHWDDWEKGTRTAWNWVKKQLKDLEDTPVAVLDTAFWSEWAKTSARRNNWDKSYNDVIKRISSIWKYAKVQGLAKENPMDGVKRRKKRKTPVVVFEVSEARSLMNVAWRFDREMVPYFAIAMFAGLRPDSELMNLRWEDINFEEGWIRVNFGNKTDTKRVVPIEDNLFAWLDDWKEATGKIVPTNITRRFRYVVRGKYKSPPKSKEAEWTPIVKWARDITRHSYGSYLEGIRTEIS